MRILLIVISGALTVSACGGGPTAPTSALPPVQQPTVTTDPTVPASPVPAPAPDPTPAPPSPEPVPAPDPTPAPPSVPTPASDTWQGTAITTDVHWYEDAPIPDEFKVKWDRDTLTFGSLSAPVLAWDLKGTTLGVFARPNDMNLQIVFDTATGRGTWTLSGQPGQATGSLTAER